VIDPRAIVDPRASIGVDVAIGPWTIVGVDVEIGDGCRIASHVVLKGPTQLGRNNRIYEFASVGADPPPHEGVATSLLIGNDNVIREGVTVERGTRPGRERGPREGHGRTVVGDNNVLLARVHVAHDCALGHHVTLANDASLCGHGTVGDGANVGSHALVTQSLRIGARARVDAMSLVVDDVPAFVVVRGHPAAPVGLDVATIDEPAASALRDAYTIVYEHNLNIADALAKIEPLSRRYAEVRLFMASLAESRSPRRAAG
jgi:UDP-N-acetylglucosamine acyltransferase